MADAASAAPERIRPAQASLTRRGDQFLVGVPGLERPGYTQTPLTRRLRLNCLLPSAYWLLKFRMALDEVEECGDVVGEARAADAVRLEQRRGARSVVGLFEEEVGDADAWQPRDLLVEKGC